MSRASNVFHSFYYFQLDALIESISVWPNSDQYVEKLQKLRKNIMEKGCKMFDANSDHFNTLNHGDFWLNNIMVKHREVIGSETESSNLTMENCIFIDFQDSCWASPAIDLHYFLNTSLCESGRPVAFNELIDVYYMELTEILKKLNYCKTIPTQKEFHEQFKARNFYGMELLSIQSLFFLSNCFIL